jgi:hypothetical protein
LAEFFAELHSYALVACATVHLNAEACLNDDPNSVHQPENPIAFERSLVGRFAAPSLPRDLPVREELGH